MQLGAVGHIRTLPGDEEGVLTLEQSGSRNRMVTQILLSLPVAIACLVPFGWVAAAAFDRPEIAALLAERPASAVLLATGLVLAVALVAVPVKSGLSGLGRSRRVFIAEGGVTVVEDGPMGPREWSEPLSAYVGIAHHIRASLSGSRHEIILVHAQPSRSVLLHFDTVVKDAEMQAMAARLGLPIVPARQIYGALVA